jgi:arylsulfatase A-like enzyme
VDTNTVIHATDLFPSLCAIAGTPLPPGTKPDGIDISPALLGGAVKRQAPLFWEYGRNNTSFAYPDGRHRSPNLAVLEGPWKLLVNADETGAELYHLERDPGETQDVIAEEETRAKNLRRRVLDWRKALP